MAVPRCVLCCSLRGGIARTAGWSDGFRQVACFSSSVVILNGLQPSLEGLGPRPSLSAVGRKPGHGTSRVTKSRRRIGRDQPTEMGERRVSERTPMVDGFRYPLATRHPHVSTTAADNRTDRDKGVSERPPFCASPFLGRYSGRQGMVSRHTRAYVECTQDVRRTYAERTQAYAVRGIDPHVFLDCLFVAGFSEDLVFVNFPPLRVLALLVLHVPPSRWVGLSCWCIPRGTQGLFQDALNKGFSFREELRSRSRWIRRPVAF